MNNVKPIQADYGLINIGNKQNLEFYVFDKEINIRGGRQNIQKKLSDGRYAVGGYYFSNLGDNIVRKLKIKKGGLELKTEQEFKLRKPLDEPTKEKIKDELLTARCNICKEPTSYQIDFTAFRDPFGGSIGYTKYACEEHINESIERENKPWDVRKRESIYYFSDGRALGRVKYDKDSKKFIPVPSVIPECQPPASSLSINGELIYRFDQITGLLEVGDEQMAEEFRDRLSGDFWKGAEIEIMLPFADRPIKLVGVKEIKYSEK